MEGSPTARRDLDSSLEPPRKFIRLDGIGVEEEDGEDGGTDVGDSKPSYTGSRSTFTQGRAKGSKSKKADRRRKSRNDESESESRSNSTGKTLPIPRLPKKQCALLIGFCGTGCNGMQFQSLRDVRTIEGVLFEAMVKAGAISQDNADDPVKVNLARAARTDAGVHAAGNVVSIKMIVDVPGVLNMRDRINEELPPEIRLWGFVRVQNSFNARTSCDSRKYTYFFPSYLILPPKPSSNRDRVLVGLPADVSHAPSHPFWSVDDGGSSSKEDDLVRKRQWRISLEEMELLREAAVKFEGTHNFHNFTLGKEFNDRSNQRYMKSIKIFDPVVHGNTEWISVVLHGQSFMLHQRKMVSVLVLSVRTRTPPQVIEKLYGPRVVFIPKMPSLGLLLEQPVFDSYNAKVSKINEKLQPTDAEYRQPIDFDVYKDDIEVFKQEHIYSKMRAIEDQFGIFDAWIRSTDSYAGNDLLYLNHQGIIPDAAVIKKGEKRSNPFREKKRFDSTHFPRGVDSKTEMAIDGGEDDEDPADVIDLADMES